MISSGFAGSLPETTDGSRQRQAGRAVADRLDHRIMFEERQHLALYERYLHNAIAVDFDDTIPRQAVQPRCQQQVRQTRGEPERSHQCRDAERDSGESRADRDGRSAAAGLQRQPGSSVRRPISLSPIFSNSIRPWPNVLTSSGRPKAFCSASAIAWSSVNLHRVAAF